MWSVVVSQPSTPGRSAQIALEALDARAVGGGRDDGHQRRPPGRRRARAHVRRRSRSRPGMRLPGLTCCGSRDPARAGGGRVRDRERGERAPRLATCVRSGPTPAVRRRAADRVAARARVASKTLLAAPRPAGRGAAREPVRQPARNVGSAAPRRRTAPCARAAARRTRRTGRGRRRACPRRSSTRLARARDHVDLAVQLAAPRSCG